MTSISVKSIFTALMVLAAGTAVTAQSLDKPFKVIEPDQVQWKVLDKGIKMAVISGDPKATKPLGLGSYMQHPAVAVHYDGGGKEGATVQIMGIGPSSTTFLFPQVGDFGEPRQLK